MENNNGTQAWYNKFSESQLKTGLNLRHYKIINELIKSGLRKDSKVLEIGCGIGTLTGLLNNYLKKGELVATDISDESVKIAEKRISNSKQVKFITTDMVGFTYPEKFDFIVMPDVLEHIPIKQHQGLFNCLVNHMHYESIIFIHIPHPKALDFIREHSPEKLQIIDQSISADVLMNNAYDNDLILISYASYSVFDKETDYAIIKFKKNNPIELSPLPKIKIMQKKMIAKIKYILATI